MPSGCGAFTSTRRCSSARIAARSIFSAASARGARVAAPAMVTVETRRAIAPRVTTLRNPPLSARNRLERQQLINLPLAVGERVEADTGPFEQREVQIRQRRGLRVLQVTGALEPVGATPGDQDRQVHMIVDVGIAHPAPVQIERMIQEASVSL